MIRTLLAPNPSAMTLDGTNTYIVGARNVAIIDPGPSLGVHLRALVEAVENPESAGGVQIPDAEDVGDQGVAFESAVILLTHTHPDHSAGASWLSDRLGARVRAVAHRTLREGDTVATDAGDITTLKTPGHTPDHAVFWLAGRGTVFCGDLMMGGLDTTLISPPDGNLGDYLKSVERVRSLGPDIIMPAHGPPFDDPAAALDRYVEHRKSRCDQVEAALAGGGWLTARQVAARVYGGEVPAELREVAVGAVAAYLDYLVESGRVDGSSGQWRLATGPAAQ